MIKIKFLKDHKDFFYDDTETDFKKGQIFALEDEIANRYLTEGIVVRAGLEKPVKSQNNMINNTPLQAGKPEIIKNQAASIPPRKPV